MTDNQHTEFEPRDDSTASLTKISKHEQLNQSEQDTLKGRLNIPGDFVMEHAWLLNNPEESQEMNQEESQKLGRYLVEGVRLAAGGAHTVHRAWDFRLGKLVAVKFLSPDAGGIDEAVINKMKMEARHMAQAGTVGAVPVYDIFVTRQSPLSGDWELPSGKSIPVIVMEYQDPKEWPTLASMLTNTRSQGVHMDTRLVENIALALCERIDDYFKKGGLMHRDIKPGNIFVNREGLVRLSDFGISGTIGNTRLIDGLTIGYASTERESEGDEDLRSEMFSIGAVLFEMLTGRALMLGNYFEISERLQNDKTLDRTSVDALYLVCTTRHLNFRVVLDFMDTVLSRKKEDRFATMAEMVDGLKAMLEVIPDRVDE